MAATFSWADTLHIAVNSCLPCLRPTDSADSLNNPQPTPHHIQRARPDELRSLLAEPTDAEALSLHTNPGVTQRNRKKKLTSGPQRRITLFGYSLFGRPTSQPIRLPDDDDALYHNSPALTTPTLTAQSTATFDSDATPLDAATVANLSCSATAALVEAEEEERRQREERRRQRKERKELKKVARVLALSGNSEFEGFQGSGDGYPGIPSPYLQEHQAQAQSRPQRPPSPTALLPHLAIKEEEDDESADLGGMMYTRRRAAGNGSNDGSDSRSRTSASLSDRPNPTAPQQLSSQYQPTETRPKSKAHSPSTFTKPKQLKLASSNHSSSYGRSKSARSSNSNHTNTDSTSIASPVSPSFFHEAQDSSSANVTAILSASTIEQGQGFFDPEDEPQVRVPAAHHAKSPNETATALERGAFPSTGLGLGFGFTGRARGAFLASSTTPADMKRQGDEYSDGFY